MLTVSEEGQSEREEVMFHACRPVHLKVRPEPAMPLNEFDWPAIRENVEILLRERENCATWDDAIEQLAPRMQRAFR